MAGLPDKSNQAGGVQDRTPAQLEGRQSCARGPEDALQVYGQQAVPFSFRSGVERLRGRRDACVVVHGVDAAEARQRRRYRPFHGRAIGHVAFHGQSGRPEIRRRLTGLIRVDVCDHYRRAFADARQRAFAADSAGRPGQENYLLLKQHW